MTITAADLALSGTINVGSANVFIKPSSDTETIGVGTFTSGSFNFTIDESELNKIFTTGTITIGDASKHNAITVGALSQSSKKLDFVTGGNLTFTGNVTASTFTVSTTSGITISNPINASTAVQISNTGTGDITISAPITANGNGTSIHLTNNAGNITVNAALDPTDLIITDAGDVTINAPVTANNTITITAGNLTGNGSLTVTSNGTLTTDGGVGSSISATVGATSGNISLAGSISSVAAVTLIASAGTITGAGAISTSGVLSTNSKDGTTLNGNNTVASFTASNTYDGDISLTNTVSPLTITGITQYGGGNITVGNTSGSVIVGGTGISAGTGTVSLTATGGGSNVRLNASVSSGAVILTAANNVELDAGTITSGGSVTLTATAGAIIDGNGPSSLNVSATSLSATAATGINLDSAISTLTSANVTSTGDISIRNTSDMTVTSATTNNGGITLQAANGGTLSVAAATAGSSGNMTLTADEIDLTGNNTIQGTGPLVLQPFTASKNITIGGSTNSTGTLSLTGSDFGAVKAGFSSIVIGRSSDGTGTVTIAGNLILTANSTAIHGGSFVDTTPAVLSTSGSGNLTLHASTGDIGASGNRVKVSVGGNLILTTDSATGNASITSAANLTLGTITTNLSGGLAQTVDVQTTSGATLTIATTSTTSEAVALTADGSVTVSDGVTLSTGTLNVIAANSIIGGSGNTGVLATTNGGNMSLSSTGTQAGQGSEIGVGATTMLRVSVSGLLNLSTAAADAGIFVQSASDLAIGSLATEVNSGQTVSIKSTGGNITLTTSTTAPQTNDNIFLFANGNITVNANVTIRGASITATATTGSILGGAGNLLATTAGLMTLTAGGHIGTSVIPIGVNLTGGGSLSLTTSGTGSNGDVYVTSPVDLPLNLISTSTDVQTANITTTNSANLNIVGSSALNDNVTFNSAGAIFVTNGVSFRAGTLNVTAAGSITDGGTGPLITTAGNLSLHSTGGAIGVSVTNALDVVVANGKLILDTTAAGGNIFITTSSNLALGPITTPAGSQSVDIRTTSASNLTIVDSSTLDDNVTINAAGNVTINDGKTFQAGTMTVTANGTITDGGTGVLKTTAGSLSLTANNTNVSVPAIGLGSSGNSAWRQCDGRQPDPHNQWDGQRGQYLHHIGERFEPGADHDRCERSDGGHSHHGQRQRDNRGVQFDQRQHHTQLRQQRDRRQRSDSPGR